MIKYLHQPLEKKDERSTMVKPIQQSWICTIKQLTIIPVTSPFPRSTEVFVVISIKSPSSRLESYLQFHPFPSNKHKRNTAEYKAMSLPSIFLTLDTGRLFFFPTLLLLYRWDSNLWQDFTLLSFAYLITLLTHPNSPHIGEKPPFHPSPWHNDYYHILSL